MMQLKKYWGPSTDLIVHKHKLYLKLGESEKAIAEIQKLIDQNPTNIYFYGLLADLYENEGFDSKALEIYNKIRRLILQTALFICLCTNIIATTEIKIKHCLN